MVERERLDSCPAVSQRLTGALQTLQLHTTHPPLQPYTYLSVCLSIPGLVLTRERK